MMQFILLCVFGIIICLKGVQNVETEYSEDPDKIATLLQGDWYSWEDGKNKYTYIRGQEADRWGRPMYNERLRQDTYLYLFQISLACLSCIKFIVRSWNVLERYETKCLTYNTTFIEWEDSNLISPMSEFNISDLCKKTTLKNKEGYMMYRNDPQPIKCQSSLYGHFKFAWLNKYSFTAECDHPEARIESCQEPGNQFSLANQKFHMKFKKCPNIEQSFTGDTQYSCMGDWFKGSNQYIAVANLRESRMEEKFRCLVKNREDQYYIGMSLTPQCDQLTTPQNSPIRLRLSPLRKTVAPTCLLPTNITGKWISSGKGEAYVSINTTHLLETTFRGYLERTDVFVCRQHRGDRYLFAKLSEEGCQAEYVCWEMLPRHHNLIRYRKSRTIIRDGFHVCDYVNFRYGRHWKYDTLILREPDPLPCPIGGRFSFGQKGSLPLRSKILGGITDSPLDSYKCFTEVTDMSICDTERKWIVIDTDLCITLNQDGKPIDANSVADYRLQCVGFWREDHMSYLVTYDPSDSVSAYRCWVYRRVGHAEVRLSQALGSACGLHQTYQSDSIEEGAAIALNLSLHDRFNDICPFYFNDGKDPWKTETEELIIFRFSDAGSTTKLGKLVITLSISLLLYSQSI